MYGETEATLGDTSKHTSSNPCLLRLPQPVHPVRLCFSFRRQAARRSPTADWLNLCGQRPEEPDDRRYEAGLIYSRSHQLGDLWDNREQQGGPTEEQPKGWEGDGGTHEGAAPTTRSGQRRPHGEMKSLHIFIGDRNTERGFVWVRQRSNTQFPILLPSRCMLD